MLRKSLSTLPPTLDQTYDRILSTISKEDAQYAKRILQWLTFSARPLFVKEVAEVLAIDVERDPAFDRDEVLEDPLEVLNICSSLVIFTDSPNGIIALAHYSVQEYLVSDRIRQGHAKQYSMQEAECHSAITKGCLKYLLQLAQPLSKDALKISALAKYSAQYWSSHLRNSGRNLEEVSRLAMDMMSTERPECLTWIQIYDPDRMFARPDLDRSLKSLAPPLYYASLLGLSMVTKLLLGKGADVNAQGGSHGSALQAASAKGYEQVVEILLEGGAKVNAQDEYHSVLQAASARGHERVVKILLDNNANVNAQSRGYRTALQEASASGHVQVVKILLDRDADIHLQRGFYGGPLQLASAAGHEQVVKLLINRGAIVNAHTESFDTALHAASRSGHEQIVKLLLEAGADVNIKGQSGWYTSALHAASGSGHEQIVKLLLEAGVDSNVIRQESYYSNALQSASAKGFMQVVEMLLKAGADVNATTQFMNYQTALQAASTGDHKQVVQMLLDAGAKPDASGAAPARGSSEQMVDKLPLNMGSESLV
jgi:ankyrin repeat protein